MAAQVRVIVTEARHRFEEAKQKLKDCDRTATNYENFALYVSILKEQYSHLSGQDPVASTAATGQAAVVPAGQRAATGAASNTTATHPAHLQAALKHAAAAAAAAEARVGGRGRGGRRGSTSTPEHQLHIKNGRKLLEESAQGSDEGVDAATSVKATGAAAAAAAADAAADAAAASGAERIESLMAEEDKKRSATTQACHDAQKAVSARKNGTSSC